MLESDELSKAALLVLANKQVTAALDSEYCRAGHLRYFLIFSIIKNDFFAFFISELPISAPVLFKKPTPSQINLITNAKNHFLLLKKFKNTESAQLC